MAFRAAESEIRSLLESDCEIPIAPFQKTANALTNKVAAEDDEGLLDTSLLAEIEKYLAAGFYSIRDQLLSSQSTGDASGAFQTGQSGVGSFEQNDYLRMAMGLDITGYLASLNAQSKVGKQRATMTWLGTPPSEQTPYYQRD